MPNCPRAIDLLHGTQTYCTFKYIAIMGWTIVRNGDRSRILEEIQKNFKAFWFLQAGFLMNYLRRQFALLYLYYYTHHTFKFIAIMGVRNGDRSRILEEIQNNSKLSGFSSQTSWWIIWSDCSRSAYSMLGIRVIGRIEYD